MHWQGTFDEKVDELMSLVSRVDNEDETARSAEIMDIYHNNITRSNRRLKRKVQQHESERPFEFLVFKN